MLYTLVIALNALLERPRVVTVHMLVKLMAPDAIAPGRLILLIKY